MEYRSRMWTARGFVLPAGLAQLPPPLLATHAEMLAQIHRSMQSDPIIACPVELLWDRMQPELHAAPWNDIVATALRRIYEGRAHFGTHLQALRTGRVFNDVVSLQASPTITDQQRYALTGAAIVAAYATRERCLDLARRLILLYEGKRPDHSARVTSIDTSCKRIRNSLGTLPRTVGAGADRLTSDQLPAVANGRSATVADEHAWTLIRHDWCHGRDQDLTSVTETTLEALGEILSYTFGWTTWLLLGDSLGAACPEWRV